MHIRHRNVAAFCAGPNMSVYYATKAFVRSFSEAIAEEVRDTGITVTAICPGPTATGFEKAAAMKNGRPCSAKQQVPPRLRRQASVPWKEERSFFTREPLQNWPGLVQGSPPGRSPGSLPGR